MKKLFPILIMIAAVAAGAWLGSHTFSGKSSGDKQPVMRIISEHTQALQPPKPVAAFELRTHRDEPFNPASLKGKWSFMFFGYTHCPDICPTTMQVLADMDKRLADLEPGFHDDTQVVFVSVDPARDTVQQLANYVPYFNRTFIGVTGEPEQIKQLTQQLGIMHMQVKGNDGGDYLVDHSASILLFGPDARVHGIFSAPHDAGRIAQDYIKLRKLS